MWKHRYKQKCDALLTYSVDPLFTYPTKPILSPLTLRTLDVTIRGGCALQQWLLGEVKIWDHNCKIQMAYEGHQVLNAVIKLVISKGLSRKEFKTEKAYFYDPI